MHAKCHVVLKAELFILDAEFPGSQSQEENKLCDFKCPWDKDNHSGDLFQMFPGIPIKGTLYDVANNTFNYIVGTILLLVL